MTKISGVVKRSAGTYMRYAIVKYHLSYSKTSRWVGYVFVLKVPEVYCVNGEGCC
jgi:hypothetical protein